MDRESRKDSISLPSEQHGSSVPVLLDGADRRPSEQERSVEAAASAGEEGELTHVLVHRIGLAATELDPPRCPGVLTPQRGRSPRLLPRGWRARLP